MKRIICMFVSVVIIIGMVGCETKSNIKNEIDNGNYDKAVEEFNQAEDIDQETIDRFADELKQIYENYNNGDIEYEDAKAKAKSLSEVNNSYIRDTYLHVLGDIENLSESKASFASGEDRYQKKEYEQALKAYQAVIPEDVNYPVAQERIEALKDDLVKTTLQEAKKMVEKDDYEGAIKKLKQINETVEDDSIQKAIDEYNEAYVKKVVEQAGNLIKENKIDEAQELLEEADRFVPDNTEIIEKIKEIENLRPVGLETVHVIDSNNYQFYEDGLIDSYGNAYTGHHLFTEIDGGAYAIFNLNKEYTTFTGTIVATENTEVNDEFFVSIYCDGKLIYEKHRITKVTEPINYN